MTRLKFPLPPFMPAGHLIRKGKWKDDGQWDDSHFYNFDGTGPPPPP